MIVACHARAAGTDNEVVSDVPNDAAPFVAHL
jgi:hypothetical protein